MGHLQSEVPGSHAAFRGATMRVFGVFSDHFSTPNKVKMSFFYLDSLHTSLAEVLFDLNIDLNITSIAVIEEQ